MNLSLVLSLSLSLSSTDMCLSPHVGDAQEQARTSEQFENKGIGVAAR